MSPSEVSAEWTASLNVVSTDHERGRTDDATLQQFLQQFSSREIAVVCPAAALGEQLAGGVDHLNCSEDETDFRLPAKAAHPVTEETGKKGIVCVEQCEVIATRLTETSV